MENKNNLQDQNLLEDNEADMKHSKTSSSRFMFLLGFFGIFIFAWSGCFNLHQHKFVKQADEVKVNESSLFSPKYN